MDRLSDTTSRLRRTFAYPTDQDAAGRAEEEPALDEQEQEELIASLAAQNTARDAQFARLLLALPLLSAVPYLVTLFAVGGGGSSGRVLVALLSLTSLGATAWTLHALPPGVTGVAPLDAWALSGGSGGGGNAGAGADGTGLSALAAGARKRMRRQSSVLASDGRKSPLELYLPYLNVALCAVLMVTGLFSKSYGADRWGHVGLGNLPTVVYVVVLVAKTMMGGVDPEKELSALKYDYKGA